MQIKPKQKTLKNGLRIITVEMPANPTVTVLVMVEAGTRYETRETNGLSHFLEHMCFKGTKRRSVRELTHEMDALGAVSNAFTGHDYTGYFSKARTNVFPKILDIVADIYQNSIFPESEIEKERGVIMGEIDMNEDMPQSKVGYVFLESVYGDQPAGYEILGPKENIKRFTKDDFINYRNAHYHAGKTIIVVAGGVKHADVVHEVSKAFAGINPGKHIAKKKISKVTGDNLSVKNKKTDQSHLIFGLRSIPLGHADEAAFAVMTGVLGQGMSSRLFMKLREEMGSGYYVSAENMASDDAGIFAVATGTEPKRVPEIVGAIQGEIDRIRTEAVMDAELNKTKESMVGRTYMGLESTNALATHIGESAILHQPLKMPRDIEKEIRGVTAKDVLKVAKKYLKQENFHLAIIGPHGDDMKKLSVLL